MKKKTIYSIWGFVVIGIIGGILGQGFTIRSWEFWVLLLLIQLYAHLNMKESEYSKEVKSE